MRTAALYRIGRLLSVLGAVAHAQDGPGRGAWEVRTPESQGLSTEALRAAEELTNQEVKRRGLLGPRLLALCLWQSVPQTVCLQ